MKLKIRYEDELQYLELNVDDTEQLWVCLSLEGEGLSQEEKEAKIQKAFDAEFNKPEYNNFHKETRHIGYTKAKHDKEGYPIDDSEPLMEEVLDDRIFRKDEIDRENKEQFEEDCEKVRTILKNKPHWAEAFIAVRMKGARVKDYAASVGIKNPTVISLYLMRADKKIEEFFKKRKI